MPAASPDSSEGGVEIRAFEAEDEARVLAILTAAFGRWPLDVDGVDASEFFRWKHMASPFGPSMLLVAEAAGEVVGFGAWLRWRLRARRQTLGALRGVDMVVHPAYRGRGIQVALVRKASELFSAETAFTFSSPNQRSRSGSLSLGGREVGRLSRFVRPHRPLRGAVRRILERGAGTSQPPPVDAETAAEVLRAGDDVSQLLAESEAPIECLTTARDLDYLRWRYGPVDEYRALRFDADDQLAGLAIFRVRRHGSAWVCRVCELVVAHNDRRISRRLLDRVRKAAPADFVTCNFPSRRDAAMCGFVRSPGGTLVVARPLHQNLIPDPTRRASWALSIGDLELL
jgi:GNAT superfamily N-acetyltransferase